MKRKKRLDRNAVLLGIHTMPRTDFQSQPRETLKSYQHKYEQDQQAARNAQLAAALFTEESAELAARCDQITDDQFAGFTTEEQVKVLIRGAFDGFRLALEDQGIKLEQTALSKMEKVARQNLTLNVTSPSVWQQIYEYMVEVGALTDRDVTRTQVTQPEPSAPQKDFDTVLAENSTESREGRAKIASAAMQSMQTEAADMFAQWSRLLYDTWGVILSESQKQAVAAWFVKWNKPYRRHESWNECRRALVKAGVFDSRMILPDEALAEAVENQTVPLDSWEARQDFARRARLLTQK
jgi:hypothetical protein